MVNGMLIDTVDDMNNSPTAMPSGFFSGLARDTMARKEEALLDGSSPDVDSSREKSEPLGFTGAGGGVSSGLSGGFRASFGEAVE